MRRSLALPLLALGLLAGAGCGEGRSGAPPGQVQRATGYNPASGKVHDSAPGVDVKVKVK